MIFLVTTTQRCGSTWLVRMLEAMTGSMGCYVNGLEMGFRLRRVSAGTAVVDLGKMMRTTGDVRVFKTHDVPSRDFDAVCAELPELRVLTVSRDFKDVLVSRYFYYRYYWPTDAMLGPLPLHLAEFFGSLGRIGDRAALARLVKSGVLRNWAEEWAAFEGAFTTPNALRVTYAGLLDGSEKEALEEFTGRALPRLESFETMQQAETHDTGRGARSRFHREGRSGQWKRWFTAGEAAEISARADEARKMQTPTETFP